MQGISELLMFLPTIQYNLVVINNFELLSYNTLNRYGMTHFQQAEPRYNPLSFIVLL